ncbi:MAG: arylamine N-acetyltransferase [Oscillospiraceae bacterium]|nr:arylamine N-acetyltransferase [Oscillospiraceae bacterium]
MAGNFMERYGKYFEDFPDIDMYLDRIGLKGTHIPKTREGLDMLQFAHLCAIPFENLDLWDFDTQIEFDIPSLWDKIIIRKRGGYCFELNAFYYNLLQRLGFEVFPVAARSVPVDGKDLFPASMHRMTVAVIDGKRYVTDVGFGSAAAARASICLDDYDEQDIKGSIHTVEDMPDYNKLVIRHTDEGPAHIFKFMCLPYPHLDFIGANHYMSATGFRGRRMVQMHTPKGGISIDGAIFREYIDGEKFETPIPTADDAAKVLLERFNMPLHAPLSDIAERPPVTPV